MRSQRGSPRKLPQHRMFQPGKRHMELIASVSRSSGLEKDGDALRDPKIQQEYRTFIQGKVDEYWKRYPLSLDDSRDETVAAARNRKENEENLLILFRKLREGLLSTNRRDAFALEVYETSLYLSVLFKSPVQTTSALSHLFPDLYISIASQKAAPPSDSNTPNVATASTTIRPTPPPAAPPRPRHPLPIATAAPESPARSLAGSALATTVILLLHHLATAYPSQTAFYTQLRQLHPALQAVLGAPASTLVSQEPASFSEAEAVASESRASVSPSKKPTPKPKQTSPPEPAPHPSRAGTEARTRTGRAQGNSPSSSGSAAASAAREPPAAPSPPSDARGRHVAFDLELDNGATRVSRPPSQIQSSPFPGSESGSAREWLRELARCLGARNYARLEALTRREVFAAFVHPPGRPLSPPSRQEGDAHPAAKAIAPIDASGQPRTVQRWDHNGTGDGRDLALEAIAVLVETLLEKARGTTWRVLRTAYREVSLGATLSGSTPTSTSAPACAHNDHERGTPSTTGDWLARSLVLHATLTPRTAGPGADSSLDGAGARHRRLEAWLEERCGKGEARRKEGEGMEGRWIFVKA
ncbi:transporter [Ganoderma sinense ZZ0214-1]|uniref:Transporter n=1 Tax=Ganoderma sinense ZZ0214-1 TaxID=1077348 RepID=A0A2G8RMK0_9APHY|nr:transporter [Ganoderma sinense ZZ0214-1]